MKVLITELKEGEEYKAEFFDMSDVLVGSLNFSADSLSEAQQAIKDVSFELG